jgi:formate hydrogenlyase transcriptional activator
VESNELAIGQLSREVFGMPNEPAQRAPVVRFAHPDALADPEKLLAAYFDSLTVGLCILDSELRYIAVNEVVARINGLPAPEHLGKTVRDVLGDFADIIEPALRQVVTTGKTLHFETSSKLPASSESGHWAVQYLPIKNESGNVTRIGAVIVETTAEKKLAESVQTISKKLEKEMSRLQMLVDVGGLLSSGRSLQQVFPQISARIRRVLRQEYAGFELHEPRTGLLVRQVEDFPLGKGLVSRTEISPHNSPGGQALQKRVPLIFSKREMQGFEAEITKSFLAEGLKSLCCVPLLRPKGALGVLVLGSTRQNAFHAEDLTLLNQVAAQLAISLENHRASSEIEALKQRLADERKYLEGEPRSEGFFAEIIGDSPALQQALDQVETVAASDATVLILGETGTGKELIAQAIHRLSRRKDGNFVKLHCAAIPMGLLESELFGHEKGAFTGAVNQKMGRMELAHEGTLFLDEVGEIPLELQPKLLRVLQDQEFERLGSTHTIKVNLRLIAATNRDLSQEMAEHRFRSDLFYRLNVFPIRMPALRERHGDVPLLIRHFVRKFARRLNRHIETVPTEAMNALTAWSWPGNVRELENLMERSVILSEGNALKVPIEELRAGTVSTLTQADHTLDSAERDHIIRVLRETRGVLSGRNGAAQRLGLKRTTLQSKMQRLKITRRDYLGRSGSNL